MAAIITLERPDSADAVALVAELEAHLEPLYPATSRHGYSVEKLIAQAVALIQKDARGFATSAGIFFRLTGAIDRGRLPTMAQSVQKGASAFLVSVDATSRACEMRSLMRATLTGSRSPREGRLPPSAPA